MLRRRTFTLPLLGVAALSGGCQRSEAGPASKQRPPPLVAVAPVEARDVPVELAAPVDLRPLAQADVGAKTLGYLDAVLVDRGDAVKKGQLVAVIRPSDLPDQLASAKGSLAQAEAQVALAKTQLERAEKLAPAGVVSEQELQRARADVATGTAHAAAAKAQLGALAVRLGETRIESPLDGVVAQRRLDPGVLVGPSSGRPILTVAKVDTLRVFVAINERDAGGLAVGKEARVEVDALPGRSFGGKVVRLAPAFDPSTRTLDAEVHLPNPDGALRPGMYGRGFIRLETHAGVPVVPATAVRISGKDRYVFVVDGDRAKRRVIDTGVDGGSFLEVRRGLTANELVVIAGADGLADGMPVRVSRDVDPYTGARASASASAPPPPPSASAK